MEDIFKRLGDILKPESKGSAPERIKELKTLSNCPEWPENPLKIFSLIERLRSQVKGTGMYADTIRLAIDKEKNYYKIIQYVKDKGQENFALACEVVPEELLKEIIEFEIPKHLLNT